MKKPRLTVITPVYNGEKFIESCLLSIIAQNCLEVEHLIVDGGSKDGTMDIVRRYAQKHPHISWISEKDNGQSSAMNKGITLAKGEIIGFLNADDFYEPAILSRVLKLFRDAPSPSFLVGNCRVLKEDGSIFYINTPTLNVMNLLIGGDKNQFPHNPASYFYHKSLHDKVGPYEESNHYSMDLEFIMRALPAAHSKYFNEIWGNYRYIPGSKTFEANEDNQVFRNKMQVMDVYLKKLPLIQQWWVKANRFFLFQLKPSARRIKHFLLSSKLRFG